eukprot:CAMPEP_0115271540 /NCGR_PEP_ID=MMETSP0270-20121206/54157_1 /TAXON_ID=71861 /ORGANISM="Scrippsiella trochoidea, Strain CCMP3099" /LENGTH=151 /DNA_ID=CAMNT_0002687913 /DNA_START=13 /DNA_END=469 /DNA_ORIENTATION=-
MAASRPAMSSQTPLGDSPKSPRQARDRATRRLMSPAKLRTTSRASPRLAQTERNTARCAVSSVPVAGSNCGGDGVGALSPSLAGESAPLQRRPDQLAALHMARVPPEIRAMPALPHSHPQQPRVATVPPAMHLVAARQAPTAGPAVAQAAQ